MAGPPLQTRQTSQTPTARGASRQTRLYCWLLKTVGHPVVDWRGQKKQGELNPAVRRSIAPDLVNRLKQNIDIALVSDAGTPLLNDPGYLLIQHAWQADIRVVPVPGACSIITALSVCPIPSQPFRYVGFLPNKAGARRTQLEEWLQMPDALVFLESPHRIRSTLADIASFSARQVMIGREMTKQYESFIVGSAADVLAQRADSPKGEFVCIVEAAESVTAQFQLTHVLGALLKELAPTQAAKLAAQICGVRKKEAYELALQLAQQAHSS